jgi:DNA modification methylase
LNTWNIIEGDCIEVLTTVPLGSARLVFCDPPYNLGKNYGDGEKADRLPAEE